MTPERTTTTTSVTTESFTGTEIQALHSLRKRYQEDLDLFSNRERAHLGFIRWQHRSGVLVS